MGPKLGPYTLTQSLQSLLVYFIIASIHAELNALLNAKLCRGVDLKKCSLYTTDPPCLACTVAILKAGLRVMVYGDRDKQGLTKDVHHLVYREKACFK